MDPNECALIVVDMQEESVNPGNPMCVPEAHRQVPLIQKLIEGSCAVGVPVYYTEHTISPDVAHDFYEYWLPIKAGAIAECKPGSKVYHEFESRKDERLISAKHTYDFFSGMDLDYLLRNQGVKTLIICGTLTNFCCESTARSGFFKGYHIVFESDVNATDSTLGHEVTLRTMRRGFARFMEHQQSLDVFEIKEDKLHLEAVSSRA